MCNLLIAQIFFAYHHCLQWPPPSRPMPPPQPTPSVASRLTSKSWMVVVVRAQPFTAITIMCLPPLRFTLSLRLTHVVVMVVTTLHLTWDEGWTNASHQMLANSCHAQSHSGDATSAM